jgi:dolichol-phosphate mannosyltransferase
MHSAEVQQTYSSAGASSSGEEIKSFAPGLRLDSEPLGPEEQVKPVLSLVIPIYNDGKLAEAFCEEVVTVFSAYFQTMDLDKFVEVIFVDDGSVNNSVDYLKNLAQRFRFVKVVELSRNFGHHIAISCGFQFTSGDYVTSFDVDMQDPPAELPKLLDHIRQGTCDVVQGVRVQRQDGFIKRLTSSGFFWLFNKLSGMELPQNCSAMRIMSRACVDAFNRYTEKVRYAIGLEYWLGFRRDFIEIGHVGRPDGTSSYNLKKRAKMALEAIISFSDMPLKLSIYTGCSFAIVGVLLGIWYIAMKFLNPSVLPGFTSIIAILLFSQGIVLMMLGVTGLYIGRILKEVQNRPLFVVRQTYNFPSD